ncbi:lysylphosphatidylglycerol synthase transmembrane domain-containing protein [Metabacillus idriensis]|uniref:lysylphosphatidylglycerol synthase transmembrane domain-containing protein n=1 Tax=Metabacillus idriensis TaxID=324768 RepID=UPI00174DAF48|nr:lysylphosphatidylglycerol synthase transmembrane domain-containing protein [Metabacillus idriensis]
MVKQKKELDRKKNLSSKIVTGFVMGVITLSVFLLWGDVQKITGTVLSIEWSVIIFAIVCTLISYVFRFIKWHYLLNQQKIELNVKDSFNIWFIGHCMSMTPGKVGEFIKSYSLKRCFQVEVHVSAPVIFTDLLSDFLAMVLLASLGVVIFQFGFLFFLTVLIGTIMLLVILQSRKTVRWIIEKITMFSIVRKHKEQLGLFYDSIYRLIGLKNSLISFGLSLVAWFMECVSMLIILNGLGIDLHLLHSIFIFSFSTLAGALSMIPGGLGIAEGSLTGMLLYFGLDKSIAVSVTLMVRLVTLWLGFFVGLLVYLRTRKRYQL